MDASRKFHKARVEKNTRGAQRTVQPWLKKDKSILYLRNAIEEDPEEYPIQTRSVRFHRTQITNNATWKPIDAQTARLSTAIDKGSERLIEQAGIAACEAREKSGKPCVRGNVFQDSAPTTTAGHEPQTVGGSALSSGQMGEDGSLHDLDNILKLTLSLGTVEQIRERLEKAENILQELEADYVKAKLVENDLIMEEDTIERVFPEELLHVSGRGGDNKRVRCGNNQCCPVLEALKEIIEDRNEVQDKQARKVAVLKWCIVIRQLLNDVYKGAFGAEVERLLREAR
ncbi:hypothetical protein ACHAO7_009409 [Fusarium culmorum]